MTENIARPVAVLCAGRNSEYRDMPGVEVFDKVRDARTFTGGMPVVCHPPCRSWSAFTRHQAKPEKGERELGLWVCEQFKECGGVVEQPAHSRLFEVGGLPRPRETMTAGMWSIEVEQVWWGCPIAKSTWLCFGGIDRREVYLPLRLHLRGNDGTAFSSMSKRQRSHTSPEFAQWLVSIARLSVGVVG